MGLILKNIYGLNPTLPAKLLHKTAFK